MPDKKPAEFLISGGFVPRSGNLYRTFLSIAFKIVHCRNKPLKACLWIKDESKRSNAECDKKRLVEWLNSAGFEGQYTIDIKTTAELSGDKTCTEFGY